MAFLAFALLHSLNWKVHKVLYLIFLLIFSLHLSVKFNSKFGSMFLELVKLKSCVDTRDCTLRIHRSTNTKHSKSLQIMLQQCANREANENTLCLFPSSRGPEADNWGHNSCSNCENRADSIYSILEFYRHIYEASPYARLDSCDLA